MHPLGCIRLSKNPYFCSKVAHLAPTVLAVLAEKRCGDIIVINLKGGHAMPGNVGSNEAAQRRSVEITRHAMRRLQERVKSFTGYRSWQNLVNTARYEGRNEQRMTDAEYEWYCTHITRLHRSSQVRMLDGFAYIFMGNKGHARTLVTVIAIA